MPGIFGTRASTLVDINLLLQITILLLLLVGYRLAKTKKLVTHSRLMAVALILHSVAILFIMIPSLIIGFGGLANIYSPGVAITLTHITLGTITEATGIFLVAMWRLASKPKMAACIKRKKVMKPLLILWIFALIFGISFYIYYYV